MQKEGPIHRTVLSRFSLGNFTETQFEFFLLGRFSAEMIDPLKIQKKKKKQLAWQSVSQCDSRCPEKYSPMKAYLTDTCLDPSAALTEPDRGEISSPHPKTGLSRLNVNQISVLFFFSCLDLPLTSEADSCSDCTHRLWMWPDVWFSFSPRCPTDSSELRLSLKLSLFPLSAKASLPAKRSQTHTRTQALVLKTDRRCVNAHVGLSWGSRCWKLSLEGNTANCWVTDTHTQPFN